MADQNPDHSPEPPDAQDDRLLTIASYADAATANIARSILDSEGIPACLGAENTNTMLWHYGTALGGVKLMVFAEQADKAKAILASHSAADFADIDAPDQALADDGDGDDDSPLQRQRDDDARRAWYAAVIGLVLCPPLLNIYSFYLLARHGLLVDNPRLRPNWRVTGAICVNLLAYAGVALFWWAQRMMFQQLQSPE